MYFTETTCVVPAGNCPANLGEVGMRRMIRMPGIVSTTNLRGRVL
jgi:hypothetical protein